VAVDALSRIFALAKTTHFNVSSLFNHFRALFVTKKKCSRVTLFDLLQKDKEDTVR